MSKSPLNGWDTSYLGPLAVCINQYFNLVIDEHVLLWFVLVCISLIYLFFLRGNIFHCHLAFQMRFKYADSRIS